MIPQLKELPFQVPLSESDLAVLGLLSAVWSQFEFVVEAGLLVALKLPMLNDQLPRDISKRLTMLKTYVETNVQSKPVRKEIIDICDKGAVAAVKRNLAVHGKWGTHTNSGEALAISWFKGTPGQPYTTLRASELPQLLIDTSSMAIALRTALISQNLFLL